MAVHTTMAHQPKSTIGPTMPEKHIRLLRKPRAPRPLDPLPQSPAPLSYTSEIYQEHSFNDFASTAPYYKTSTSLTHPKSGDTHYTNGGRDSISTRSRVYHTYINPGELKYILDPFYRNKTSLGTYVEGQPLLKPYKPRGPDALPLRAPRTHPPILSGIFEENMERYCEHPKFTLQDFLLRVSESEKVPLHRVHQVAFSRHTYKEIQRLLSELCLTPQKEVHQILLKMDNDVPDVTPRIPQKQLLIEMAALVKEQMSQLMHTQMKTLIRPLPKYSPSLIPGQPAPHTEIVLYEDIEAEKSMEHMMFSQDQSYPSRDSIVHSSTGKIFQGARRSNEPFVLAEDGVITPSELAILDSMMNGGVALSLKAHFICELPDIELLRNTVLYLNLSFNDFRIIPFEVFELQQLTVLKLRNNPIREITSDITTLKNLKTLVISFCLIATLPLGLFNLKKLEQLDIAYNRISFIPNEIKKLRSLRLMNVEGNQLGALPCGALQLASLKYLNVKNNYMHPLFWQEHSKNSPQRLVDLAAMTIATSGMMYQDERLPDAVDNLINRYSMCDCCKGALYGPGLRIIRPVPYIFGIKHLPFIFHSCSLSCLANFKSSTAAIVSVLYGVGQS